MILSLIVSALLSGLATSAWPQPQQERGTIGGQILSSAGVPATGVPVRVLAQESAGDPVLMGVVRTGKDGRYVLAGLPPGRYHVAAGLLDFPTYYPGTTALSSASVITVSRGAAIEANITLARGTEGFKVSGRVIFRGDVLPTSRGTPTVTMLRMNEFGPVTIAVQKLDVGSSGASYELSGVLPGDYAVITNFGFSDLFPAYVSVSDQDVIADMVVPHWAQVQGTITDEKGWVYPSLDVSFAALDGSGIEFGVIVFFSREEFTAPRETFSRALPEGTYRVVVEAPKGSYFKSLTAGSLDLLRDPLKITEKDSVVQIQGLVAKATPVSVRGRVFGVSPFSLTTVELNSRLMRRPKTTFLSADGTFEFSGIVPGFYEATVALTSGFRATVPITVDGNDVAGVEIQLPRTGQVRRHASWLFPHGERPSTDLLPQ